MTAFLDVHLEQIAHVVERGRGLAEMTLLLHRSGLGVALDHDQAAQHGAILAGHFLPGVLALVHAEVDLAAFHLWGEQNAPAVIRHPHVVELGPALRVDAHRGAQINERLLEALRSHVVPPVKVAGVPFLQRALDPHVLPERNIVRDQAVIVDLGDVQGVTLSFFRGTLSRLSWPAADFHSSCPGLSRASTPCGRAWRRTWMAGTSPAMTVESHRAIHHTLSLLNVGETPLP